MAKTGKLVIKVLVRLIMSASTLSCNILNEIEKKIFGTPNNASGTPNK